MKYQIGTLASHSSLQILKGAKDEGFETIAYSLSKNTTFYSHFNFIDKIVSLEKYEDFYHLPKNDKIIIIPHGSFVAYLPKLNERESPFLYYGNKEILDIEGNRLSQNDWMMKSGLNLPKIFHNIDEVNTMVIVKYHGAKGGEGYFIAKDKKILRHQLVKIKKYSYILQEYIQGIPVYLQYFYSSIHQTLELMGIDRRYESDVDGIGRIPSAYQDNIVPTYTVIGNFPIVIRESLLPKIYEMGEKVIKKSKEIIKPKGLFGPFCLETVVTPDQRFICIEISCRIVAGTNLFINGSPYTDLMYGESMSTGKRVAREIKEAIHQNRLNEIVT